MDYGKLIEAVKLCGSTPKIDQCKKCAYYAGGDMSKCIPVMTNDAANAISALQIDLASMRGAANSYKAENENLRAELEQVRRERDAAIEDLSGQCEYCSRNDECINRKGPHWNCWEWRGSKED